VSYATLLDFRIIDETDDYIVVDKPSFLLTHPTKPNRAPTLWKQLHQLLAFEIAGGGQVSIVNRLDRETSGLGGSGKNIWRLFGAGPNGKRKSSTLP